MRSGRARIVNSGRCAKAAAAAAAIATAGSLPNTYSLWLGGWRRNGRDDEVIDLTANWGGKQHIV